jgi:peroxiredoxin
MSTLHNRAPVTTGEAAPDFSLPAIHREGMVSLGDYTGRSALLLMIFRGLYCPFCRRAIAQFGAMNDKLRQAGVEALAVVATDADNARLYFRHRPAKVPLAADPACSIHQAYGLPSMVMDEQLVQAIAAVKINPTGDLPQAMNVFEAAPLLNQIQGYAPNETDLRDMERQGAQLKGQFLLDRDGVVRWSNIECANDGLAGFGRFPTEDQLLGALRVLH